MILNLEFLKISVWFRFVFRTKLNLILRLILNMSLSKKLCLRSDLQNSHSFKDCVINEFQSKEFNYRRDSFDVRFCDDLSIEVLQYLSLEDKLRLQCVSKQFQRTVFKRQSELYINLWDSEEHKKYLENKDLNNRNVYKYYYIEDQNLDSFKALLRKCPKITSIEIIGEYHWHRDYNPDKFNQVFRLIIENCNNLNEVITMNDLNDSNLTEFYRKFGSKIKNLPYFILIDFNRFPNIEKLQIDYICNYNDTIIPQLKLAKLKKLEIAFRERYEYMLQTFIDTFPTLTHLSVVFESKDQNAIYKPLRNISNLKHLIHLKINNKYEKNNKRFCGLMKQMANNCQNLKSIVCRFYITDQNSDIKQLLSLLSAFPALKRLNLRLNFLAYFNFDEIISFKGLSNITHLTISFWIHSLNEKVLKNIDIDLPKLQYLEIKDKFDTTPEGVIQMADILSRLSRLETLKLKFKTGVHFKPIEDKITEKCRKIIKIEFKILDN